MNLHYCPSAKNVWGMRRIEAANTNEKVPNLSPSI